MSTNYDKSYYVIIYVLLSLNTKPPSQHRRSFTVNKVYFTHVNVEFQDVETG
jgi:hypothetical protein